MGDSYVLIHVSVWQKPEGNGSGTWSKNSYTCVHTYLPSLKNTEESLTCSSQICTAFRLADLVNKCPINSLLLPNLPTNC